jgi:hypothetical protein
MRGRRIRTLERGDGWLIVRSARDPDERYRKRRTYCVTNRKMIESKALLAALLNMNERPRAMV